MHPRLIAVPCWLAGLLATVSAAAAPPEYAQKQPQQKPVPLVERLQREVKPLKHARGKRWPMILWECVSFEPQRPEVIQYMNRMSDYLFVCARYGNHKASVADVPWVAPH